MNDEHDKEMLDENTSNFQGQKSLTYEFSTLDETVNKEESVKSLQFKTKKSEPCNFRSNQC